MVQERLICWLPEASAENVNGASGRTTDKEVKLSSIPLKEAALFFAGLGSSR